MIRVLVVDDHSVVRHGLAALLSQEQGVQVVGQAADGETAVARARELRPDVVVLDVRMPGMGGIEACRQIGLAAPDSRCVFLTSFADEEALVGAMLAGARGYVLKNLADANLVEAVRAVARGESVLDPTLGASVAAGMKRLAGGAAAPPVMLTDLELSILRLIAEGCTNREIGDQIHFTEKTIRNYVSTLLTKLNLRNRAEAAAYAVRNNLLARQ